MSMEFQVPPDLFRPKKPFDITTSFSAPELKRTEELLGVQLPAALVEVLKVSNGGVLRRTQFPINSKPNNISYISGNTYRVDRLPGIDPTHAFGLTQLTR